MLLGVWVPSAAGQQAPDTDETNSKRIFGIIPNFRTSSMPVPYAPLSMGKKYKLAWEDAFDRGTVALAALFAAEGQLSNANPSFGQGVKGYGHYLGTSYADYFIGDYMTEAIYPSLLHRIRGTSGGVKAA